MFVIMRVVKLQVGSLRKRSRIRSEKLPQEIRFVKARRCIQVRFHCGKDFFFFYNRSYFTNLIYCIRITSLSKNFLGQNA